MIIRIKDIFLILISNAVDLRINSHTIEQELKLLKKIDREIRKECTKIQLKEYKEEINTLKGVFGEIEDFLKQKKERSKIIVEQLENELIDLKEFDELDRNLENYRKWKENMMLEKKKKILDLTKELGDKISE